MSCNVNLLTMRKKNILNTVLLLMFVITSTKAQVDDRKIFSLGFWNFSSVYGEFRFGGMFHQGGMSSQSASDYVKSKSYYGGLQLNTNSYIWSPNFITLGINANYTPSSAESKRQLFNNRYDLVDSRNINIYSSILPTKKFTLNGFASFNDNYDNRENLTDLKNQGKTLGMSLAIKSKRLPVFMSYTNSLYEQHELTTIHQIIYNESSFIANLSKSYTSRDKTELSYNNKTFCRGVDTFANVINNLQTVQLRNTLFLDSVKNTRLSTDIYALRQCGIDSFDQLRVSESFNKRLKNKTQIASNYSFFYSQNPHQCFNQNQINAVVSKQFFESLTLGVNGEYNKADQTEYKDWFLNLGYNATYSKRILRKNYLTISYNYNTLRTCHESGDQTLNVINEVYTLDDNAVVIIKAPYVLQPTLLVKDITGTIIYTLNIDYQLYTHGNYLEIKRIPGGLIPPNGNVYLTYTATQPGSNQYDANQTSFSADLTLLKRFLDLYYHNTCVDYCNLNNTDALYLNYFNNSIYGVKSDYKFLSIGAEVNDYQSNLYPYKMARGFLTIQGKNSNKLIYALNANYRYFYNIQNNETKNALSDVSRTYYDANANVTYVVNVKTKIDFNAVYTYQNGQQVDLELLSGRIRLTKSIRSISLIASLDAYQRSYLNTQKYNSIGGSLQIVKKFKY